MTTRPLQVPIIKHSYIIGQSGATIQNIQNTCGVAVLVPKKEENVTTVSLVGTEEGLNKAQEMIEEVVQMKLSADPLKLVTLIVPTNKFPFLIGTKGVNKKAIEQDSNVVLTLPARESNSEEVHLIGNEVSIEKAKIQIAQIIRQVVVVKGEETQNVSTGPVIVKRPLKDVKEVLLFTGEEENDSENFNTFLSYLGSAVKTLDICVYTISDDEISRIIIALHKSDVKIRIITDDDCSLEKGSDIAEFHQQGIPVRMDSSTAHMHHKFCIMDSMCIMNGSFNWTRQAHKKNKENVVIAHDNVLVKAFQKEFDKLWDEYKDNPLKFM